MVRFALAVLTFAGSLAFADYSPVARYALKDSAGRTPKVVMLSSSLTRRTVASAINTALGQSGPGVQVPLEALILESGGGDRLNVTLIANRGQTFQLEPISLQAVERGGPVSLVYRANESFTQVPGGLRAQGTSTATLRFDARTGNIDIIGLRGSVTVRALGLTVTDSGSMGTIRGVRTGG